MTYDLILRGGHVCDPRSGVNRVADVAFSNGKVAEVAPDILTPGKREEDVTGLHVLPGLIDSHVHVSGWMGGAAGHRMLALAGVTTALDMAGPIESVMQIAASTGTGLTLACIDYVRPGHTVDTTNPQMAELRDVLARARRSGAVGLKVLGGHFPLTSEASARVIELCGTEGAHVAFHAGTLDTPQNLHGLREACALAGGHPLHMPHVNSYSRGFEGPAIEEAYEATQILARYPNIWSESYLAPINGNSAKCANGIPESVATQRNLIAGGYEATLQGLEQALRDGWGHIHLLENGVTRLATGDVAVQAWRDAETDIGMSYYVNPAVCSINLALLKRPDGQFPIDALATDGGGLPRNDLCERGLALVHLNGLTLSDFVHKTSTEPARMMGLSARKGHLAPGADADVTVIDLERRKPLLSYGHGRAILRHGQVVGQGTTMIVPPEGIAAAQALGLDTIIAVPGSFHPVHAPTGS
ncbi:amidohydrolase family protein [Puniceibacterium sp. IMCC21224]|uniref:amidohydrolase family protein n=1 Tax=Puniceibacterium sp. IMCC21224 TaxID=1618204 RepID=UPI00064DF5FD|nr:amidohydrolase family protein [Puniceibacterium sp. IMCC21224]KMK68983.1 dihydroorotase-like cyclic amidohydrolase [Puniceibacterium sp. IMCC21224]